MAALASLASINDGELIRKEFMTKPNEPNHIYISRWFFDGRPIYVSVNDYLPGKNGVTSFAHPRGGAYWVEILEKSWAKIFGTYMRTEGG